MIRPNLIFFLKRLQFPVIQYNFSLIKQLRELTGSPVQQCKIALQKFDNDLDKAQAYLIEKGYSTAQKKKSKEAREGVISVKVNNARNFGVMAEINCQTDFVARTELFQDFVEQVMNTLVSNQVIIDEKQASDELKLKSILNSQKISMKIFQSQQNNLSIENIKQLIISKVQENINIRRICSFKFTQPEQGILGFYVHNELKQNVGKKACLLKMNCTKPIQEEQEKEVYQLADNLAMQILGNSPEFYQVSSIKKEQLTKIKLNIKNSFGDKLSSKSEVAQSSIINGKLKKYYEENVLYNQVLIQDQESKENRRTVQQYISEIEKQFQFKIKPIQHICWDFR